MDAAEFTVTTNELDIAMCWRLLARAWVGRVGFADRDGPVVLPVNCAVSDGAVVFRTGQETALYALGAGTPVAFEVDHTDRVAEEGWSVLVRGHLWEMIDPDERAKLRDYPLHPWVEGVKDRWMKIVPSAVTGRITGRHRVMTPGSRVSYMRPD
jgi:nitroimidazol reductase NimA-like FMN-containing flavoprotein (pyridoxamine 5'-phosphate oxidase superfamily)